MISDDISSYVNPQLFISTEELASHLDADFDTSLLVIDLRPVEAFAFGHLPGAIHLDLFGLSLIDTDPAPLDAFMWMIGNLLMSRGVSDERTIVVYDEKSGYRAARAFWFLEYFGHHSPRVLDGGFASWQANRFCTQTVASEPKKRNWVFTRQDNRLATWYDVKSRLGKKDSVILDTRSEGEYFGTIVRAKRAGAVPGAIHIEWIRNLNANGTFKSGSELLELYESSGVTQDKEVISYCQGGYRAAHSYLALRLLGFPRVRNYIGSWKEWANREDLPIDLFSKR